MEWLGSNWIWLALGAGFIAFLAFGRGGCGMSHGGHQDHAGGQMDVRPGDTARPASQGRLGGEHAGRGSVAGQRHRHGCC
jgi:hypothetical protein